MVKKMSLQSRYNEFKNKIALTRESEKYKVAREKDDLITSKVEKEFRDEGYEVDSNFMQGSLAVDTGIIPLDGDYDIDRAIVITKGSSPDNPVEAKKVVKRVLTNHGFKQQRIKIPCVTADYQNNDFHIDLVIYRKNLWGNYQLAVGKEHSDEYNRSWNDAEPRDLIDWIKSRDNPFALLFDLTQAEKSQFYRLVRYIKRWRDFKYTSETERKKVYSIALTIMFKESFKPCVNDDTGLADDHTALKNTLTEILNEKNYFQYQGDEKYKVIVHLPVTPNNDIFNSHAKLNGTSIGTSLRYRMAKLLEELKKVDDVESETEKCGILRKQFGEDFPIPDQNTNSNSSTRTISSTPGIVGVNNGA